MKTFYPNLVVRLGRWFQRGPVPAQDPAATGHDVPDPLTMFLLARREARTGRAAGPGHPALPFSINLFPR